MSALFAKLKMPKVITSLKDAAPENHQPLLCFFSGDGPSCQHDPPMHSMTTGRLASGMLKSFGNKLDLAGPAPQSSVTHTQGASEHGQVFQWAAGPTLDERLHLSLSPFRGLAPVVQMESSSIQACPRSIFHPTRHMGELAWVWQRGRDWAKARV